MKRRAFSIKVLLFVFALAMAGAIINVAVAWACAWSSRFSTKVVATASSSSWYSETWTNFGAKRTIARRTNEGKVSAARARQAESLLFLPDPPTPIADSSPLFRIQAVDAYGWPTFCLGSAQFSQQDNFGVRPSEPKAIGGYEVGWKGDRFRGFDLKRLLPFTSIWPGFAINTIFYAAVLWVLFALPFKVRRWRRIKRGQCASCGYSLRGTPHIEKCPECGATGIKHKSETPKA
jgi:hypothetical protein